MKRTSIYLSGLLATRIENRLKIDSSVSSTVNGTVERLDFLLQKSRPQLLPNEWAALMEALCNDPPRNLPLEMLLNNISHAVEDHLRVEKWGLHTDLLAKVRNFSLTELLFVLEMSERWRVSDSKSRIRLLA